MSYQEYLETKGLSKSTVNQYVNGAESLLNYTQKKPQNIGYQDLLHYINYLKRLRKSTRSINQQLSGFRHFFAFLIVQNVRSDHPAEHLRLKGQKGASRLADRLSFEELEGLYLRYTKAYPAELEKQVLLSFLVYQGLLVSELRLLTAEAIDLQEGKIQVPSDGRSNARTLELNLRQMLLLVKFLDGRSGLLFAYPKRQHLVNRLATLMQHLRKLNPEIRNSRQIRGSVIAHWLRTEDLRIVQYKAGHKYVSTTEGYQVASLDELQDEVSKVHPLK